MTAVTELSTQYGKETDPRTYGPLDPQDAGLTLHMLPFEHTQVAAGTTGSVVKARKLPAGRVVVFPLNSYIAWSAQGTAGDDIHIGYDAYTGEDGVAVVADPNAFDDTVDVENAGRAAMGSDLAAGITSMEFNSKDGVDIIITLNCTTVEIGETLKGHICIGVVGR